MGFVESGEGDLSNNELKKLDGRTVPRYRATYGETAGAGRLEMQSVRKPMIILYFYCAVLRRIQSVQYLPV